MALFGGSPRGIDEGALRNALLSGLARKEEQIKAGFRQTPQIFKKFEQRQQDVGQGFIDQSKQRALDFGKQLEGIDTSDLVRQRQAKARELAFRDLPSVQQNIRESLAATGGLGRGAAIRALQAPVLQAAQTSADQSFAIQSAADEGNLLRRQQAVENMFNTTQGAALQKFGIDKDTAMLLLETGRADVLDRAAALAGIEGQRTQGLLDIEQARQQSEMAKDAARRQRTAQLISGIGTLGGAAVGGLAGGLPGASIGSQLGGQLGGFAGSGSTPDLSSSLLLLSALRGPNKGQQRADLMKQRGQNINQPIF